MDSDSVLSSEAADGADGSPLPDIQSSDMPVESSNAEETEQTNAEKVDEVVNGAAPTSSSDAHVEQPPDSGLAEADHAGSADTGSEEMDIEENTAVTQDSSYIGDNCLSSKEPTESNSPSESVEPSVKGEEATSMDEDQQLGESPDQSVSSAAPTSDPVRTPQDDESSTMDDDLGEGVASSDDVNDISSAAQQTPQTGISSSTAEGTDISSSASAEPATLISSTANGPQAADNSTDLMPKDEFEDADTSEGGAGAAASAGADAGAGDEPTNGAHLITPNLLPDLHEDVSSSGAGGRGSVGVRSGGGEGAVSSSVPAANGAPPAPLPPTDAAHALATLASAALHHHEQAEPGEAQQNDEEPWHTVGIVNGTSFTVTSYLSDPNVDLSNLSLDSLPNLSKQPILNLEPGTAYKFRVAAINNCGRGEFSEESAFKTCLPGFPGAPSAIKISKSAEGAHLSWEPPQVAAEGIFEYSVYLAVRSNTPAKDASKSQLAFVRVYCGNANQCVVAQASLGAAHVDSSTKPAIIFRIAARNDKGYGPATQVRWLQDIKATGAKRPGDARVAGASPSKQAKPMIH